MARALFPLPLAAIFPFAVMAGPELSFPGSAPPPGESVPFVTPSLDLRIRYEYRNIDPLDDAHALTTRSRLGFLTAEVAGLSAFAELEATHALVDDFRSNPADDSTSPAVAGNTVIADPENFELNQGWIRHRHGNLDAKLGRQRIIRNNAAFVADVGWRQNEQTYDAASVEWTMKKAAVFYGYSPRALRIFGDDANDAPPGPPLRDFEGDFHFLDGTFEANDFTVGGYAYLLDIDNNANVGRSHSVGAFYEGDHLRAELAWQNGLSALAGGDYGAAYAHLTIEHPLGPGTASAGCEYLQEHFKTPFALLHAFNGLADVFVQQRAGLNDAGGAYQGLTDLYLSYVRPGLPLDLTLKAYAHWFLDDALATTYGYEADLVLVKKIHENLSATASWAWFVGENYFPDTAQVTFGLNYKF